MHATDHQMAFTVFWMWRYTSCVRRHDALFILPTLQVCWSLCSIVTGGFFFDEFSTLPVVNLTVFGIGCLLSLTAAFLL
jgi:hypothetical protein